MTPKEKALELIDKFDGHTHYAERLVKEMPKHIADFVDAYAEKITNLEKFIIDETLKENHSD